MSVLQILGICNNNKSEQSFVNKTWGQIETTRWRGINIYYNFCLRIFDNLGRSFLC